ncbi:MAG TPA: trigger factor [Bacteroidota bacterium]|jgi:trigger factor|nr:trigger factor [Bacteroidota bacterium]
MDISITDITDVEKEISIHASASELEPHLEKAYKRYAPTIEIKGFRKGKAPIDLVKKIHGESIEYNALDTIASEIYRNVVQERDIHPIGDPVLTDIDYKRGEALSFKIKYELKPNFQLGDYKNISLEKPIHPVTDAEMDDEILRLRKSNSTTSEAASAADDEHVVIADIQQLDEAGTPLIGKKNADTRLYLAGGTMYQEIKDVLRNAAPGETKRAKFEAEREGKKQTNHLELTIKKVEKINIPELDEALVKKVTNDKVSTVDEFRKQLREELEKYWEEQSERKLIDSLVGEIVRRHDFVVPESLIKGVTDSLMEDFKNRYPNKKLPADFNEQEFREQNRGYAVFQAKWYLIRERLLEAEHLEVSDEDIERYAAAEASKIGIEKERLVAFYKTSGAAQDKILSDKLLDLLKKHAIITEKIVESPEPEDNAT